MMQAQFSLSRMLQLAVVVAVISALFGHLPWPLALLALCGLNVLASVWFWLTKRSWLGNTAGVTAVLIFAALFFTDWGSHRRTPESALRGCLWSRPASRSVSQL